MWFGQFRSEWPVERWGKWNEVDYTGKYYPAFACGSGSLLSADLLTWLAANRDKLHPFQGEDVSLGIWLAAVNPQLIKVGRAAAPSFIYCRSTLVFAKPDDELRPCLCLLRSQSYMNGRQLSPRVSALPLVPC